MSKTFIFLTGTRIEIVADTLEEAENLIGQGEYKEIETETMLLEVTDVE
jgi:hypothetical protein